MSITKPKSLEDYIEIFRQSTADSKLKKQELIKAQTEYLKEQAISQNKQTEADIQQKYADLDRALLVRKIINSRVIKENNENLGLTRSGKNLSENAANQIAYSKGLADSARLKQSDLNKATLKMQQSIYDADLSANERMANLNAEYEKSINSSAKEAYEKDVEAAVKIKELALKNQKAQEDADKEFEELLIAGIQRAKNSGSGYLFTFIKSLGLTEEQMPILRSALTRNGVPADFFDNYIKNGYQGVFLLPIDE